MPTATPGRWTRRHAWHAAFATTLALAAGWGCTGYIGDAGSGSSTRTSSAPGGGSPTGPTTSSLDGPTHFDCKPDQKPAMDQLRALTTQQYLNTLSDLVSIVTGASSAGRDVLASTGVTQALALLPPNTPAIPLPLVAATNASVTNAVQFGTAFPDGGWLRADQSIQQSRVAAFYGVGLAVAQELTSPSYLTKVVGSCAVGSSAPTDSTCLTTFIKDFGSRTLRRAISSDDITLYSSMYSLNGPDTTATNPAAAAYQDVITGMLNSPEFLYFVEHGDAPVTNLPGVYKLSAYELATRLSYQVWDTLPDTELWAKAQDGTLLDATTYKAEVERLFADPRAETTLNRFFTDYFQSESLGGQHGTGGLNYYDLAAPATLATARFQAFAGSDLPTPALYPDMLQDALGLVNYYTWKTGGTLHDLLTSSSSFAKTQDVAKIYGVPVWDGKSTPPSLPAKQRPGLFTRALFVSAGLDTSPILKGVYMRRYVLCDTLGTPPAAAANKSVPITTDETTRQATTALTSGSPCNSCHTNWINPLGFATEDFDGLGRFRTQQVLYNVDGSVADKLSIDTEVNPYVMMTDATTTARGPAELMNLVEKSDKPAACLARSYFRYTFARFEDLDLDACALETTRSALENGGRLIDMWKSIVETPAFQQRTFQ
jgi:Protein of unknown function (DUF1592)/Protein of unknown function (DUF1588)/Protein of unknown function (DUF1595)/Protein of unknown function (DUF1585)